MAVHIENVTSTVDVTDGASPLGPETMRRLVEAVLAELDARSARAERAARDRRVAGGSGGDEHGDCGCGSGGL